MGAEPERGKSVPELNGFQPEIFLAPFTPEKPVVNPAVNGKTPIYTNGQYYPAETEDYLSRFTSQSEGESSYPRYAWEANDQGERWAPSYTSVPSWLSESASSGISVHQGSVSKETESFGEWRGMTFKDLLAMNHGLGTSMGGYGFLSDLDFQFHSSDLVSESQDRMGFIGSNPLTQTPEIQQRNAIPNGSGPVFAPETPDQWKRLQDSLADKNPNKQDGEESQVSVIEDQMGIKVAQSASDSIAIESYDPENGDKAIEQKPRRKKHRPKVVREGKPKQGPKPRTPKPPTDANETPKPKRTYVRKSKTNAPSTTPPENVAEALDCKTQDPAVKACKKALNFDMEDQAKEMFPTDANETPKQKRKYVRKRQTKTPAATPLESGEEALGSKIPGPAAKSCKKGLNFDLEEQDSLPVKEKDVIMETTREETAYDAFKNNETMKGYMPMSERDAHSIPHPTEPSSNFAGSPNYSACASSNESEHSRGLKRVSSCSAGVLNTGTENQAVHCSSSQTNYMSMGDALYSCTHGMFFPEIKKRKTERMSMPKPSHILSSASLQSNSREAVLTSKYYYSISAPHFNVSAEANSQAPSVPSHQNTQSVIWGDIDKLMNKRSKAPTSVIDLNSQEGSAKGRAKGTRKKNVKAVDTSCMEAQPKVSKPKQSRRKYVRKNSAAKFVTSSFNMVYAHSLNLYGDRHFTGNSKGPFLALPWIDTSTTMVDDIIEGLKQLSINKEDSNVQYQEQNSLILYQGKKKKKKNALILYQRDGVMIPFEGTQSSKVRSRAKVDIDAETDRVWNLLLEDINNQGIDGTDEEKTKWWEEERTVFRGRVDSFIARMRLVQGDRRFSPWKGSVVDSVVGVFLTQNVSDHLSSSAYMSLAARYPVKSANKVGRDSEEETGPIVEEPEIRIVELDDNSDDLALNEKVVEGHICDRNSRNLHDSDVSEEKVVNSKESQLYAASSIKESETPSTSVDYRPIDDVTSSQHSVISSQNSVESPSVPTPGKVAENGLCFDNSSEGEVTTNSFNPGSSQCSRSFVELLKMAEKPMLHASHHPIDPEEVVIYGDTSQKAFRNEMDSFSNVLNKFSAVYRVDEVSRSATEFQLQKIDSKGNVGPSSSADNVCSSYVLEGEEMVMQSQRQPVNEQQDRINLLTEESVSPQMTINLPTVSREHVATESTCGSNNLGEAHNVLKEDATKQKTGKNPKKPSYDWDSLRKQAEVNGQTRQKTANTMDSIDWEAIRCADVRDIAYTIKERGMNNRLADRIKEFLDRLVNDHGSIDLEWLRDVPPDKAKEYLLSIKGLGLKSVECVRLLTLRHLAFPVDTNVGRIAVRLGWVPLQPLPEALQLHLLELYPVLESIQKYLWPRLCKLDQRTLYELHYHMITFGKVFCTKRQPNCNACPLRGECRHFASAFASARLALPGPQDKSIILSDQSNPTHQDPPQVAINSLPMPLLMAEQASEPKSDIRNCEPIVEIPASPEPEPEPEQIEMLECDIEDAFSEDPNEIPTIKLNMEEFTQTLTAYMQSNKELQGDMSKALVALATEAASIPAPKLKNISRLRTEHHVYELPDTHYLLRGMDKREPDDPCPYLLAIWAPGETANSTQPPEKRCNFQEPGQLCSDETCSYCNSQREANSQIVRGTLLIPCRTAMRGSFPLNGTYFQVNEVFADQASSLNPIQVPTSSLWNLPRRTVYFGTSVPTIFKGLSTEYIQHCFWRGYVCVRGFDQKTRAPRPLMARLHYSAYKSKGRGRSSEQD